MTCNILVAHFILASLAYLGVISFLVSEWLARRKMKLHKEDPEENYK